MITACYVHVPGDPTHERQALEYFNSVKANPPGVDHKNVIICQGHEPTPEIRGMFESLPNCRFYIHDDTGWDIGAYIAVARTIDTEAMLCFGGSSTVRRMGWMKRMQEAWEKHGEGFYGSLSSYQVRPHFNTNGFWCSPQILIDYPNKVLTHGDRYEFEHGEGACWWRVHQSGKPAKLVTWCGEYDWPEWRVPNNISCRGDQSNCLTYFRINYQFEHYAKHDPGAHNNLMYLTDAHIIDPKFRYPTWELSLKGGA